MKAPVKLLVALAMFSTVGIGIATRNAAATQTRSNAVVLPTQSNLSRNIGRESSGISPAIDEAQSDIIKPSESTRLAQVEASDGELPDQQEEQQEEAQLRSLARITADQARQAAQVVHRGVVDRVTLDNEDGNLVYKVMMDQAEITVDAGNGRILQTEQAIDESEQNDSPFRSSIQVPNGQDGDREVSNGGSTR